MLSSRIVPLSLASHSSDFCFIFFHFLPLYFSPLFRMACSACLWQIYGCLYFVWLINSAVIYVSGGFSDSTSFSSAPCLSELCVFALLEVIRCLAVTLWEFISLNSSLSHISLLHDLLLLKTKLMLVMCSVHACARRWLSAGFVWVYQELHFLPRAWAAAEFFFVGNKSIWGLECFGRQQGPATPACAICRQGLSKVTIAGGQPRCSQAWSSFWEQFALSSSDFSIVQHLMQLFMCQGKEAEQHLCKSGQWHFPIHFAAIEVMAQRSRQWQSRHNWITSVF